MIPVIEKPKVADLLFEFPKDSTKTKPFTLYMLRKADDGYVFEIRKKIFDEEFKAKRIDPDREDCYLCDWLSWQILNAEERIKVLKICSDNFNKKK